MDEYYNVEQNNNRGRKTRNTISNIFAIVIIIIAIVIYRKYDFNFYTKGIQERDKTTFSRDADIKYGKERSYKIENRESNDAMFYREVTVRKNTPYRVTCMVRTENVVGNENEVCYVFLIFTAAARGNGSVTDTFPDSELLVFEHRDLVPE